jgi:hypothetical protein
MHHTVFYCIYQTFSFLFSKRRQCPSLCIDWCIRLFISLFNEFKFCRIIPNLNLWTARTNWCPQNIELTKKDIYLMFWPIISCNSWSFYICFVPILVQPMYCYVLFMSAYSRINFRWVIFHELNNWIASIVPINATCRLPALYRNQSMGVQFYIKL